MKTYSLLLTAITCAFSLSGFAQSESASAKIGNSQMLADAISGDDKVVVAYHVEERVNMNFGGHITSYNVPDVSMIRTNDLGPNNTRTITPIFGKAKKRDQIDAVTSSAKMAAPNADMPMAKMEIAVPVQPMKTVAETPAPVKVEEPAAPAKGEGIAIVNIIETYERILDKGYESIDMLKRVGNSRFFDGDLSIAAKWYSRLFALTKDLDAEYYFRFAQSLKSVNQLQKSKEMMDIFERKTR